MPLQYFDFLPLWQWLITGRLVHHHFVKTYPERTKHIVLSAYGTQPACVEPGPGQRM